jgi:hypothetical protein
MACLAMKFGKGGRLDEKTKLQIDKFPKVWWRYKYVNSFN